MQMKSVPFLPVARTFRGRIKPDAFFANFMQIIASNKNLEKPLCCYISIYLLSSSWYCSFSINYNIISRINDAIHVLRLTLINYHRSVTSEGEFHVVEEDVSSPRISSTRRRGWFESQNNFILNSQFCHLAFAFRSRKREKLAGKLHRIDFVRSGEIGVCFTAHLAETVEDVKTIKRDKPGTFFVEKEKRKKKGEERRGERKEEREKSIA